MDDNDTNVCAACDLAARLCGDLDEAKNQLLAHASELALASGDDASVRRPMTVGLRAAMREHRLHVIALENLVADLLCDCQRAGRPAHPERTDAAA